MNCTVTELWCPSLLRTSIFSVLLWRGAHVEIAHVTLSSLLAHWSLFCTAVLILISRAQPSDQFVRVGSFLLWRGADFSSLLEILAILWDSLRGHGIKTLTRTVWKSLWEGFVEILVKSSKSSLHEDLEHLLFWRCLHATSLGRFLEKDLARRGPYIKTVNTPASESS